MKETIDPTVNFYDLLDISPHASMDSLYVAHKQLEQQLLFGRHAENPLIKAFYNDEITRAYDTLLEKQRREKYHFQTFGEIIDGDTGKIIDI